MDPSLIGLDFLGWSSKVESKNLAARGLASIAVSADLKEAGGLHPGQTGI